MDKYEYTKEWLIYAERDFSSAEYLLGHRPLPMELICFLCQQTVEKCLKGFLVLNNAVPDKTHNLDNLCRSCMAFSGEFKGLLNSCNILNKYSVQPRYPNEIAIEEEDVTEAIKNARKVFEFVKPLLYKHKEDL